MHRLREGLGAPEIQFLEATIGLITPFEITNSLYPSDIKAEKSNPARIINKNNRKANLPVV